MYEVVKNTIIGWWLGLLVALMLWYRGKNYDRALGIIIFLYGLVSLFNYGVYNNANSLEVGVATAAVIGIAAFIPLLSFLTIKSYSIITGLFLFILVLIISYIISCKSISIFYTLGYTSEYETTKGRIVYHSYNGDNTFIGIGWITALTLIAIVGFVLLSYFNENSDNDLIRLVLMILSILILLYMGYNSYLLSKIYYVIIVIIALALLA